MLFIICFCFFFRMSDHIFVLFNQEWVSRTFFFQKKNNFWSPAWCKFFELTRGKLSAAYYKNMWNAGHQYSSFSCITDQESAFLNPEKTYGRGCICQVYCWSQLALTQYKQSNKVVFVYYISGRGGIRWVFLMAHKCFHNTFLEDHKW